MEMDAGGDGPGFGVFRQVTGQKDASKMLKACGFPPQSDGLPQIWMTFPGFRPGSPASSASYATPRIAKVITTTTFTMDNFVVPMKFFEVLPGDLLR